MIKRGSHSRQVFSRFSGRPQSATRREDRAQIRGEPFIHPQEFTFHRLLKIGSCQPHRAAELTVPGVREFVREESRLEKALAGVGERTLGNAVVAALVMFLP